MKQTCTRRLQFCAGHRVMGHENKCSNLHGHNYVVFVTASADQLDNLGRVIDFSVLKEKLGGWIDKCWDHGMIIYADDDDWIKLCEDMDTKLYALPINPTAENMAQYLIEYVCPLLFKDNAIEVSKVVLWETENCYAEATR